MKVKIAAKARIRLQTSAIEKPCNLPVKACQKSKTQQSMGGSIHNGM